jgi:GDP-L-fucose synthase
VVPGLIRRFHAAAQEDKAEVAIWGSGRPLREFLHVDDLADALVLLMERYSDAEMINVGSDQEVSIAELGRTIADVVGYKGRLVFDPNQPDGTPRKLLDSSRLRAMGWSPRIRLDDGLRDAYAWFIRHEPQ